MDSGHVHSSISKVHCVAEVNNLNLRRFSIGHLQSVYGILSLINAIHDKYFERSGEIPGSWEECNRD